MIHRFSSQASLHTKSRPHTKEITYQQIYKLFVCVKILKITLYVYLRFNNNNNDSIDINTNAAIAIVVFCFLQTKLETQNKNITSLQNVINFFHGTRERGHVCWQSCDGERTALAISIYCLDEYAHNDEDLCLFMDYTADRSNLY